MARPSLRLPHNAPGDFYVDSTCIDCDTCRWMAPATFVAREGQASVGRQPADAEEERRALMALVSCPTASIGADRPHDVHLAFASLPDPIEGGVFHCGFHSAASFGAASYLVVRPQGNVLVDSPRFTGPLVRRIEELGGVRTMFLTHQDDVADHARWHRRFGCTRILHADDVTAATREVEEQPRGTDAVRLDDDLLMIPTPGHTAGSACLQYRDTFLFTGDHLAWDDELGHPIGFRGACWHDWGLVVASTERLLAHPFEWLLPGHGRRHRLPRREMQASLRRALLWMRA